MAQQQQRYKVVERIAAGGMAEVFRAESAGLEGFKKTVAIKRVLPHLSEKKQFIGMFLDEARVSAHLSHSNCVQVFDIGVGDNTYFIVMEYVDGADLKSIIEYQRQHGTTMPIEEACLVCVRICEGLAYAHELQDGQGKPMHIVHRDMSPPNVLITRHGEVKIVDFGLAKANSQLEKSEPGIIKGKFSYLSPEAAQGMPVDARTDIFAVGIILWELLAGRRLFLGETDLETVRQVQRAQVPPIRQFNPKVASQLEAVLAKGLARDPNQRYQTAREFGHDLNQVLFQQPRAVSSFDISKIVEPIWIERQSKKEQPVDKGSLIGSLIDEALFEFTSLEESEKPSSGEAGSKPINLGGFEDVQDWATDLGEFGASGGAAPQRPEFEAGNLSALEDDSPFAPRRAQSEPSISDTPPPPSAVASASAGASAATAAVADPAPRNSLDSVADLDLMQSRSPGGKGGVIAVILVLVVVAGLAGAYFGGLLPQDMAPR